MLADGPGESVLRRVVEENLPTRVLVCTGASPAGEPVIQGLGPGGVAPGTGPAGDERVLALLAAEVVHPVITDEDVMAPAATDPVSAVTAQDDVVAASAADVIVAVAAADHRVELDVIGHAELVVAIAGNATACGRPSRRRRP